MRRPAAGIATALLAAALASCGSADQRSLRVSAASSLQAAFTKYAGSITNASVQQSFAGSDTLAAQIEQGARPDVFAAADTQYPDQLYKRHLVEKPVVFARNRLVLAVPADSNIKSLSDVAKAGTKLVIGTPNVPVGAYTREVLDRLPKAERSAILANVRSQEPDDASIVGKLAEGAADAGFVYRTDVVSESGRLNEVELPASLRPDVSYGIAVLRDAPSPELAQKFVNRLMPGGPGAQLLHQAGFLPPS